MKEKKLMTAEQAFNYAMNKHPSLYTEDNIADAKFKYFDHIFNTIGNGYGNFREFSAEHTINDENKNFIESFPEKYITSKPLYYAYTKVKKIGSFEMGESGSELPGLYTEEELKSKPEVLYKVQSNRSIHKDREQQFGYKESLLPYPNFSREYSMVWRMDMSKLDASWMDAAKEYYVRAKEFFNSEASQFYHGAAPKVESMMDELIASYEKNFIRYKKDGMTEIQFNEAISKAYELNYDGDTKAFIEKRWEVEQKRILKFIDKTLDKLGYVEQVAPKRKNKM